MDRRLIWLATGTFATGTVVFMFAGLLPSISSSIGVSIAEAGQLMTVFSVAYAIGTPVLSTLAGSMGRRRVAAFALASFVAANAFAAGSGSYAGLMAAQVVLGAAGGLFGATAQAIALALVSPEQRARAVSIVISGTTFAVALGAPLGALLGNVVGWRAAYVFTACLALLCLVVLWLRLPRDLPGVRLTLSQRLGVIARPGIFPAISVTFLLLTGSFAIISYVAPLATDGAGLSPALVPIMLLAFGCGAVVGNYAGGQLSDRIGATRLIAFSLGLSIVVCLLLTVTLNFAPTAIAGPALIALIGLWGFIGWAYGPAQASRLAGLAPDVASLTLPLNISAMYFGIAAGSFVGGQVLLVAPVSWLGLMAAFFMALALCVLALSRRRLPRAASGRAR